MDEREMMAIVESILYIAGDPIELKSIAELLNVDIRQAKKLLNNMADCYNFERRGLQIISVNDKYQLGTRPEHSEYIEQFIGQEHGQSLSQAVLESLAIVAYKQPITKAEVEAIRGVKCDHTLSVLSKRGYIKEVARRDTPGRPIEYGTTELFLRNFGLTTIEDLPSLEDE